MAKSPAFVEKTVTAGLCSGCGACEAIAPDAIRIERSDDGFARPRLVQNVGEHEAKAIAQVCSGRGQSAPEKSRYQHPVWGGYETIQSGWSADPAIRFQAASGGALTGFLIWLLESNYISGVVQVTADDLDPLANRVVVNRTAEDISKAAASRYAPSSPVAHVSDLLDADGTFAFLGKPCDVASMRRWARIDPRINDRFVLMLSFFCAGVPSLKGAEALVEQMGLAPNDVAKFSYRGRGWPGPTEAVTRSGSRHRMRYEDSWGRVLSGQVQQRCRICADGIGLGADIAFADAWETDEKGYPLFEEQNGKSLILARSKIGADMIERAKQMGHLESTLLGIESLSKMQPGQLRRRQELLGRLIGRVLTGQRIPRYRGMGVWRCAAQAGPWVLIRAILGTARRGFMRWRVRS